MKKRLLSLLLSLTIVLTFAPAIAISVSAELSEQVCFVSTNGDSVFDSGENKYASISEALSATTDNATAEVQGTPTCIVLIANDIENVVVSSGRNITLDLNGHVLKAGPGKDIIESTGNTSKNNCVILVRGNLTLTDSGSNTPHYYKYSKTSAWMLYDEATPVEKNSAKTLDEIDETTTDGTIIKVLGGVITGGESSEIFFAKNESMFGGAGVFVIGWKDNDSSNYSVGNFILKGGNIIGNKSDSIDEYQVANGIGGGVLSDASNVSITGGNILGNFVNASGGGIACFSEDDIDNKGRFTMSGGTIAYNVANLGGGLFTFGIDKATVGGTTKIYGNTASEGNNYYVIKTSPFDLGTSTNGEDGNGVLMPTNGMSVGVTLADDDGPTTGAFTTNGNSLDKQYFFSDSDDYIVNYVDAYGEEGQPSYVAAHLELTNEKVEATTNNVTTRYTSIENALKHGEPSSLDVPVGESTTSPTSIRLLGNVTENVNIPAGRNITLDLNGHVLKADLSDGDNHSVITNEGNLTIVDGNSSVIRYFTDEKCPHGVNIGDVCNETICSSFSNTAIADGCYETYSNVKPNGVEDVDYIVVTGGCITGGVAGNGAGINNDTNGNLTIIGGNIIGNVQIGGDGGGGIFNKGTLILNGGSILGNAARNCGGGVDVYDGSFTMSDGKISHNNAIAETGGGVHVSDGTFVLSGGKISNNAAKQVGGVYNQGVFKFTGGSIVDNNASAFAGGVLYFNYPDHESACILGGNAIIARNKSNGEDSNLIAYSPVTIGTGTGGNGVTAPTWTTPIGVTVLDGSFTSTAGAFTTNGKNTDIQYFVGDDNAYFVKYVTDHLELVVATVKIDKNITNGKIKVDNQEAGEETTVTITATPNSGYQLDKITVTDKDGKPITVDNSGKFVMPADSNKFPVTVSATFKKKVSDNTGYKVVNTGVEDNNNSGLKLISLLSLLGIATVTIAKKKKH